MTSHELSDLYRKAHDAMWSIDGLHPQEAFDELLKYLFFKQMNEEIGPPVPLVGQLRTDGSFGIIERAVASTLRRHFLRYLKEADSWTGDVWKSKKLHLSDAALAKLHSLFVNIDFRELPFDIRSAALREFLSPQIRRGLGIYLTPDAVSRMMVAVVSPDVHNSVYDPACGSGTFLIETLKFWHSNARAAKSFVLFGSDKNPRMLLIAKLNLAHQRKTDFRHCSLDFLCLPSNAVQGQWPEPNSFDLILTNPPFGLRSHRSAVDVPSFIAGRSMRESNGVVPSEILFVEQCLRMLKAGGRLAIVLPRSVITNDSLSGARKAIGQLAYVYAVVSLPPEAFATEGTQATTCCIFFRKYNDGDEAKRQIRIAFAQVENVGYDSTGRIREGNQLPELGEDMRLRIETGRSPCGIVSFLQPVVARDSLSALGNLISSNGHAKGKWLRLGDLAERIETGRTPARAAYTDDGMFILKVGNLTGHGIDWEPRDRNFVNPKEGRRRSAAGTVLRKGDIVLTSSAHAPRYIAKKVDIIEQIPSIVDGQATFVGELIRISIRDGAADPYRLLAYLRSGIAVERIQRMIRGQTAHLMPNDLKELVVPLSVVGEDPRIDRLQRLLTREAKLALQLSELAKEQRVLLRETF